MTISLWYEDFDRLPKQFGLEVSQGPYGMGVEQFDHAKVVYHHKRAWHCFDDEPEIALRLRDELSPRPCEL